MNLIFLSKYSYLCFYSLFSVALQVTLCHEVYHHHHYPDGKYFIVKEPHHHSGDSIHIHPKPHSHPVSLLSRILSIAKEYFGHCPGQHISLFKPTPMEEIHSDPSKIPHYFHFHQHIDFSDDHKHHHHEHHHKSEEGHGHEHHEHYESNHGDHDDHGHHHEEHHEHSHDDHFASSKASHKLHSEDDLSKRRLYSNFLPLLKLPNGLKIVQNNNLTTYNNGNNSPNKQEESKMNPLPLESTPRPSHFLIPIYKNNHIEPVQEDRPQIDSYVNNNQVAGNNLNTYSNSKEQVYKFPLIPRQQESERNEKVSDSMTNSYKNNVLAESHGFPFIPPSNPDEVVSLIHQKTPVQTTSNDFGTRLHTPQFASSDVYSQNQLATHESSHVNTWSAQKINIEKPDNVGKSNFTLDYFATEKSNSSTTRNDEKEEKKETSALNVNQTQVTFNVSAINSKSIS